MFLSEPRGFADHARVAERLEMLAHQPEAQPLRAFAGNLAMRRKALVPHPDPADAGVNTRVLIVLEAPGPMTVDGARPGSGFISVDNNDPTAVNTWRARAAAGLHEDSTTVWNLVPWYLGAASRKPTAAESERGALELRRFMQLLPRLEVVVLAGTYAQAGWNKDVDHLLDARPTVIPSPHPSNLGLNQPGARDRLAQAFSRAASYL